MSSGAHPLKLEILGARITHIWKLCKMASFNLFFSAPSEVLGEVRLFSNGVSVRSREGGGLWVVVFAGVPQGPARRKGPHRGTCVKRQQDRRDKLLAESVALKGVSREDQTPVTGRREK